MIRAFFEILPVLAVGVLLGMWVAHVLRQSTGRGERDE